MTMANLFTSLILMANVFTATLAIVNRTKLVLPLIHGDYILSPHYNPKLINSNPAEDIRADLVPFRTGTIFLVNVSIGEPPVPQFLILDTGSPLTWVCTSCAPGMASVFNPSRSSTYNKPSCDSPDECLDLYFNANCQQSQCGYHIEYADQSRSVGFLATEKFTFVTFNGGIAEVGNLAFGVGLENRGNTLGGINGILGLEAFNTNSLVAQVGYKFSYCIGNISNPQYTYNQLVLGDGAIIQGYSTPMKVSGGHYLARMGGISVGDKQLQIDEQDVDFDVVVDSGTTLTRLLRGLFEPLTKEVQKLMDSQLQSIEVQGAGERPCYQGNIVRDLKGFPIVTLHLGEGADLVLDAEAMFIRVNDEVFCMAVDVDDDHNIIGILAQQYYNVGFDLKGKRISFQRIDCELLED